MGDQEPPPDRTLEIRSQLRFPTRMQSRPKRCSTSPQPSAAGDAASPPSCPALPALRPVSLAASALSSPPPLLFIASHSGVVGGGVPSAPNSRVTKSKTVSITPTSPPAPLFFFLRLFLLRLPLLLLLAPSPSPSAEQELRRWDSPLE